MRRAWIVVLAWGLMIGGKAQAGPPLDVQGWKRVDSRYCTIWIHPSIEVKKINKRVSTWRVRPRVKAKDGDNPESELGAKCDTLFRRAQELLDMYPPGVHTTIKITREHDQIKSIHASRYGHGTDAIAFYMFEENTIYAAGGKISESVLIHEMAHCIIDHYFGMRPPRKIEEMLAVHVDREMRD